MKLKIYLLFIDLKVSSHLGQIILTCFTLFLVTIELIIDWNGIKCLRERLVVELVRSQKQSSSISLLLNKSYPSHSSQELGVKGGSVPLLGS